ncbi:putative nuclease of restriction endonuclease-like (RecB) superfamily [Kineococcus xinjiangensis]|uniref:Putative nuclease of restriction endonuclease-like (RecB) superfamily n=1 Tax=Kineococcus xinjiangensis TaxID=512762 RepID=A0A2S6IC32_9ACTN|nr:PDDEXK nuclease domain-containing protein [Kineococcus xinjiangensis]PPK90203.1 putative nuclease of restriction endonuclease-like (RecB) superfamily [Kineococcus xinjiangensis]
MAARDLDRPGEPVGGSNLPAGYGELLEQLKERVRTSRVRAARAANIELLRLYWSIGRDILVRQQRDGWGAKIVDRLAEDLRSAFPDQRGFSRSNLHYMRALAAAWPTEDDFVPQAVGRLPWGHVRALLDRLDDRATREWYATQALHQGWSRDVLANQIMSGLHTRIGAAPSNFAAQLPAPDSELAQQLTRDPYVFDHLAITDRASEKAMEQGLMDRLQQTLTAFGNGMAFVGQQVRFQVGDEEMIIDLLLFHVTQLRYVVIELKIGRFSPAYAGQLGAYVALIDDRVRDPAIHAPTVGILLCRHRDEQVVRYALAGAPSPMAVATYTYDTLPPEQRAILPGVAELTAALTDALEGTLPDAAAPADTHPNGDQGD